MLLSTILGKKIYDGGKERGVADGVFLSVKSRALKYLSCRAARPLSTPFCLPFQHIDYVTDVIRLKKFAIALPERCEKFTLNSPVYNESGVLCGNAVDMEIEGQFAIALILDNGRRIPAPLIATCHDAIILKKPPLFPLSLRIPAASFPLLGRLDAGEKFITKKTLLSAAKKGNLIKFTLTLPPFDELDGVFCGEL